MNRKKPSTGGFESMLATSKDLFNNRMSTVPNGILLNVARFKGDLGAAIAVITSLTVGFLTIPNNILYFIDNKHGTRSSGRPGVNTMPSSPLPTDRPQSEYAYIHAGIALIVLGCLAIAVSIVLSYFALESKRKMDNAEGPYRGSECTKRTRTVLVCLIMMNIELFMAVIAGCMELLYRPLIGDAQRLHNVECAIAVFNLAIYIMYVVTMALTTSLLKGIHEGITVDSQRDFPDVAPGPSSVRDYGSRSVKPYYYSQNSFM
ncbi:hypothetical protein DPEC_G00373680 [Dallia pectoralis]|nr:hypothetical protein DPEC_G00373680 [Dallia pectoralis]